MIGAPIRWWHKTYVDRRGRTQFAQTLCPKGERDYYSTVLFANLVEQYWMWTEKGISPGVEIVGWSGQNPLVLEAFRVIALVESRRRKQEDGVRNAEIAAARAKAKKGGATTKDDDEGWE